MANIVQWQPFRELMSMRRDLDRLFDETLFSPSIGEDGWSAPLVDLYQTDDEVVVKAAMPGVKPEDVDIQITGDQLHLHGEVQVEKKEENADYHLKEQRYRSFTRTLTLPAPVMADKADAKVVDGVLTLTLPKAEEARPKVIKVKAK